MDNLPYPWDNNEGLAPVLVNNDLWAKIFPGKSERKAIKSAAKSSQEKNYNNIARCKSIENDEFLSKLVISVLSSRRGRASIFRAFKKFFRDENCWIEIAQRMYKYCVEKSDDGFFPELEDLCTLKKDNLYYLDLELFKKWLTEKHPPKECYERLVLYACSFAVLQPEVGEPLFNMLINKDPQMQDYMICSDKKESLPNAATRTEQDSTNMKEPEMEERILELRQRADTLYDEITESLDLLHKDGTPVPDNLIDDIEAYNYAYCSLKNDIEKEAKNNNIYQDDADTRDGLVLLSNLFNTIKMARQVHEEKNLIEESIKDLCSNISKIYSNDKGISLGKLYASSNELLTSQKEGSVKEEEIVLLKINAHPLQSFIDFVLHFQKLDSKECARLFDIARENFGQDVAFAVMQRKVFIDPEGIKKIVKAPISPMHDTEAENLSDTITAPAESVTKDDNIIEDEAKLDDSISELPSYPEPERTWVKEETIIPHGSPCSLEEDISDNDNVTGDMDFSANQEELSSVESKKAAERLISPIEQSSSPELPESEDDINQINVELLQAELLNKGDAENLDWSYWLAYCLGDKSMIPLWLMEITQIGLQYQPGFKKSEERLRDLFNEAAEHLDTLTLEHTLLLAASTIRPSLMAPFTYPIYVMRVLSEKMNFLPKFNELSNELIGFAERGTPLAEEILNRLNNFASWESENRKLKEQTITWFDESPRRKLQFAGATYVWQAWVKKGGLLRDLIEKCMGNEFSYEVAQHEIGIWRDKHEFKRLMDEKHEEVFHQVKQRSIGFGALEAIKRYVSEALALAEDWIEMHRRRPGEERGATAYSKNTLKRLKPLSDKIIEHLEEMLGAGEPLLRKAAVCYLKASLMEISSSFSPEHTKQRVIDPVIGRDYCLLLLPEVSSSRSLETDTLNLFRAVIRHLDKPYTPQDAFAAQLQGGHIHKALDLLIYYNTSLIPIDSFEARIDETRREWKQKCEARINETREKIQEQHLKGAIDESKQSSFKSEVEQWSRYNEEKNNNEPDIVINALDDLTKKLLVFADQRHREVSSRLDNIHKLVKNLGQEDLNSIRKNIEKILETGDFTVAEEYLARIESIQESEEVNLDQFAQEEHRQNLFEDFLTRNNTLTNQVHDMLSLRRKLDKGDFDDLPEFSNFDSGQREIVLEAIKRWNEIQTIASRNLSRDHIGSLYYLLRWFGFQVEMSAHLTPKAKHGGPNFFQRYEVEATIESPIPLFGSFAHSRHNIVLAWGMLEPEQLAQWLIASKISSDQPVTILYFNRLDSPTRRRFIHTLRKTSYCSLLIDAGLFVWLGMRERRTEALFAVGLAGGNYNPYMPDIAGGLPSEMFFGRAADIVNLWRVDGACIVYGGRQLGKSALLQQVIKRYHDPRSDQYVIYSGTKHTTDIWELIRHLLEANKLLPSGKGRMTSTTTKSAILQMLQKSPSRRILILLDECDQFLDEDSRNRFEQTALIRDLMSETNRRFKVVLTGLHNVQRFQRIPNQPLAHFGDPICVGPLQPKAALELVMKPLNVLGYEFATPSLAHRVLAHTNYNPCLIQLFCHYLVEAMQVSSRYSQDKTPPFIIDDKAILQVYKKVNLTKKMRERFDWTLGLDKRYLAIGYTFAYLELTGEYTDGLRVNDVLQRVIERWESGFKDTNVDELSGLLDEMIGLGVLIITPSKHYRLRSPNVVRLLGGESEVIDELDRLENEPYEPPTDPQTMRRVINTTNGKSSPLSVKQESEIISRNSALDLIIGSPALGIEDVYDSLQSLCKSWTGEIKFKKFQVTNGDTPVEILSRIKKSFQDRNQDGIRIYIDPKGFSSENLDTLLRNIAQWINSLTSEKRFIRVVCHILPGDLMSLRQLDTINYLDEHQACRVHRLRRWHNAGLKQWFSDIDRSPEKPSTTKEWIESTGGWPVLIEYDQKKVLSKSKKDGDIQGVDIVSLTGLSAHPDIVNLFETIAELGPMSANDLYEIEEDQFPREKAQAIKSFLEDLDMISGSDDNLQAETILAKAVVYQANN